MFPMCVNPQSWVVEEKGGYRGDIGAVRVLIEACCIHIAGLVAPRGTK